MGSPELPEPTDDNLRPSTQVQMPIGTSDDSDNESMNEYDGYEPLPMMDDRAMDETRAMDDDGDEEEDNGQISRGVEQLNVESDDDSEPLEVTHGDPNMPPIETVDSEVTRQVWNVPRPQELQIQLDATRTNEILNAMANFQLPNVAVPEWANGVPEERWKEELLQRIRQRKESPSTSSAAATK